VRAEKLVDQRGFADVRAADQREPDGVVGFRLLVLLRRGLDDPVEQIADAQALRGGHGDGVAEAERVKFRGQRLICRGVDLVGRHHDRERPPAQQIRHLTVAGPESGSGIDHEHHHRRVSQRRTRLGLDLAGELVAVVEVNAARVDQRQGPPVPVRLELLAVPGDPCALVDDRLA